jgi:hypothetical protein
LLAAKLPHPLLHGPHAHRVGRDRLAVAGLADANPRHRLWFWLTHVVVLRQATEVVRR